MIFTGSFSARLKADGQRILTASGTAGVFRLVTLSDIADLLAPAKRGRTH
jgi:hypothetical protein